MTNLGPSVLSEHAGRPAAEQNGRTMPQQPTFADQIPGLQNRPKAGRQRGAPPGNANARKHGHWTADALELWGLLRLQLRVAEVSTAYLQLAVAVVAMLDGEPGADRLWKQANESVDSRIAALSRASSAMERFLIEYGRAHEARDLVAEVAAVVAPLPTSPPPATTAPAC